MDDGSTFPDAEPGGFLTPPPPHGPRRGVHPLTLAAVAVAGVTIGVAAVLISDAGQDTTAAVSTPSSAPASPPAQGAGGGLASLPPLTGTGGGLQVMLEGRVTSVSATSITLGGAGPNVSARITRSTQFSGKIRGISGVKVGDQVRATLSGSNATSLTATSIEDPGTAP